MSKNNILHYIIPYEDYSSIIASNNITLSFGKDATYIIVSQSTLTI